MRKETLSWQGASHSNFVTDGNSSAYGEDYEAIKKILSRLLSFKRRLCGIYLERMDSNLRKYKRDTKGKLSDGWTVGGQNKTKTL